VKKLSGSSSSQYMGCGTWKIFNVENLLSQSIRREEKSEFLQVPRPLCMEEGTWNFFKSQRPIYRGESLELAQDPELIIGVKARNFSKSQSIRKEERLEFILVPRTSRNFSKSWRPVYRVRLRNYQRQHHSTPLFSWTAQFIAPKCASAWGFNGSCVHHILQKHSARLSTTIIIFLIKNPLRRPL